MMLVDTNTCVPYMVHDEVNVLRGPQGLDYNIFGGPRVPEVAGGPVGDHVVPKSRVLGKC